MAVMIIAPQKTVFQLLRVLSRDMAVGLVESSKIWLTGKFTELRLLLDEEEVLAKKFIDKNTQLTLQAYGEQIKSCEDQIDVLNSLSDRVCSISQEPDPVQLLQAKKFIDKNTQLTLQAYGEANQSCEDQIDVLNSLSDRVCSISQEPDPVQLLQEFMATERELKQQMRLGELCHPVPQSFAPIKTFFKGLVEAMQSVVQTPLEAHLKDMPLGSVSSAFGVIQLIRVSSPRSSIKRLLIAPRLNPLPSSTHNQSDLPKTALASRDNEKVPRAPGGKSTSPHLGMQGFCGLPLGCFSTSC
ncbi:Tripartite motif-containing protein 14 [Myotis davidii]|uniref:Tripartite motif-containing protein 14 n=1 Tax=Myotis davidii TaxID=225400 RepID=L5M735_MYODS|nr:Tripartite motif-containing protein 14 [Myotis davidii]